MPTLHEYEVQSMYPQLDVTVRELQRLVRSGDIALTKTGLDDLLTAIIEDMAGETKKPLENQMTL